MLFRLHNFSREEHSRATFRCYAELGTLNLIVMIIESCTRNTAELLLTQAFCHWIDANLPGNFTRQLISINVGSNSNQFEGNRHEVWQKLTQIWKIFRVSSAFEILHFAHFSVWLYRHMQAFCGRLFIKLRANNHSKLHARAIRNIQFAENSRIELHVRRLLMASRLKLLEQTFVVHSREFSRCYSIVTFASWKSIHVSALNE